MKSEETFVSFRHRSAMIAALVLTMVGCQSPYLIEKSEPFAIDQAFADLLSPSRLSSKAQEQLRELGLESQFRKNPETAVQKLQADLPDTSSEGKRAFLAELLCNTAASYRKSGQKEKAAGWYVTAARIAFSVAQHPAEPEEHQALLALYNHACGLAGELIFDLQQENTGTFVLNGPFGDFSMRILKSGPGTVDPASFDELKIAEFLEIKGFERREVDLGVGGALVGYRNHSEERAEKYPFLAQVGMALPVTATLRFGKTHYLGDLSDDAELEFHDTLVKNITRLDHVDVNLASDLTAPLALLAQLRPERHLGIKSVFKPADYIQLSGLYQLEPIRKDKIPIVMVHGLTKTPAVWIAAINELRADPVIRENYQFLLFQYPSGLPSLFCGARLRDELDRYQKHIRATFPGSRAGRDMVLIGKSFGGLVSSLQVRSGGDPLRELFFDRPLDQLELPEKERESLRKLLYFEPHPAVSRVVFMATPHQGTDVADKRITSLGNRLIKYPLDLITDGDAVHVEGMTQLTEDFVKRPPTSVYDLRSNSPVISTVFKLPFSPGLKIHSVIGKIGDGPLEDSNDKMVPYWSSHLDVAISESISPCKHGDIAHHPKSVAELHRILHLHLRER